PFDDADIADRGDGGITLAVALREGLAVTLEQRAPPQRIVVARQFLAELVDPGAHDRLDGALEAGTIRIRRLAGRKRDDEVHPNQLPLGEERMKRAHAALVGLGKVIADGPA